MVAIISAAIRPRQAKPSPVRIPVTMLGSAPGSSTSVSIGQRPAPSEAAAWRSRIGIVDDAEQRVVGDDEEDGVEDHEGDRPEAVAEPERRDRDPGDAGQHREEAEAAASGRSRHALAHAHGDAERHGDQDARAPCRPSTRPRLAADMRDERAVADRPDSRRRDGADAGEDARVDVEDRDRRSARAGTGRRAARGTAPPGRHAGPSVRAGCSRDPRQRVRSCRQRAVVMLRPPCGAGSRA